MSKLLIELNAKTKNAKIKEVKISPIGLFSGYDGRVFKLDEKAITNTKHNALDIPLNVEHCSTDKGCQAVGWFKVDSLTWKEDGVYALLELTKEGGELVTSKKYRYLSPEFTVEQDRSIISIDAVALVNAPNLNLEINQKRKEKEMDKQTDKDELQKLQDENATLKQQLEELQKSNKKLTDSLKEQTLDEAVANNKILPAEKDTLKELNTKTLKSYLATREPMGHTKEFNSGKGTGTGDDDSSLELAKHLGWE